MTSLGRVSPALALALCACASGPAEGPAPDAGAKLATLEVTAVALRPLETATHLEGELLPFEAVALFARAQGFVSAVPVDRGTVVKRGQLLVTIVAPEIYVGAMIEGAHTTFTVRAWPGVQFDGTVARAA